MRLEKKGMYRRNGELFKLIEQDNYEPIFKENHIHFKYKYADGAGLNKEEFKLYENWIMQSGNAVIETNSLEIFDKGDKVILDNEEYIISKVSTTVYNSLNGVKKILKKKQVIYCD